MQPNDDFRQDDAQLREMLQEWRAPQTPESLEKRVLALPEPPSRQDRPSHQEWWRFLLKGYIRVPVPVACCVAALVLFAAWRSIRPAEAGAPCSIAERHSIADQPAVCTSAIPGAC